MTGPPFIDAAVQMRWQPIYCVTQLGVWIIAIDARRVHQAHHRRNCLPASKVTANNQFTLPGLCSESGSPPSRSRSAGRHRQCSAEHLPAIESPVDGLGCC